MVTRLGVMMFGTDNRHSIEKARSELGYGPKVDIREGIRLAAHGSMLEVWNSQLSLRPANMFHSRNSKVMKSLLGIPKAKVMIGLLIGIGLLFLVSRFVNLSYTFHVLLQNLTTPEDSPRLPFRHCLSVCILCPWHSLGKLF